MPVAIGECIPEAVGVELPPTLRGEVSAAADAVPVGPPSRC